VTSNLPRGIRNHNPGNLRKTKDPWQGLSATQSDPEFFQFSEAKWGIRALARLLIAYQDKLGLDTVEKILSRYAPPVENNTSSYIGHVAKKLGVESDEKLDVHEYRVLRPLVEAIILHENGIQPYTDAQLDAGLVLAGVEPPAKALSDTRTIKGSQIAAGATVAGVVAQTVRDIEPAIPLAQRFIELAPWAAAAIALVGIGWVVYARLDDRRRGLR
jgi:hypothetical protein